MEIRVRCSFQLRAERHGESNGDATDAKKLKGDFADRRYKKKERRVAGMRKMHFVDEGRDGSFEIPPQD